MKACVTGVTGFIGCRLALRLREAGIDVVALGMANNDVEAGRRDELIAAGIAVEPVDIGDRAALASALAGCDWVFHLAAAQHEAGVGEDYFRRINVDGTRNMLEAAIEAGVNRFVHGSTIGVYGDALTGVLDESSALRPANHYGRTKLEGERLAIEYASKLPVVVVRISETYGPGDRRLLKLFGGISRGVFFVAGGGRNLHQLIYVDDLVDGLVAAARSDVSGEVYVLAGEEALTTDEMCSIVASAVDGKPPWLRLPLWPLLGLATTCELVCRPLGIQPPIHRRRLDFFRKSFRFDASKAQDQLGFAPHTTFAEGATRTAAWYRAQGLL